MEFTRVLRQEYKTVVTVVLLSALAGMVYIYPFGTDFRFTVSVAMLAALLLYFQRVPAFFTASTVGLAIFAFRMTLPLLFHSASPVHVVVANYPSIAYYLVFGAMFQLSGLRRHCGNIPFLVFGLSIIDIVSNVTELLIRPDPLARIWEVVFSSIAAVAVFRALLAVAGFYALRRYHAFVLAEDQGRRYNELIVMIAQLKTELFYLNKSSQDIERIMADSYWLYKNLNARTPSPESQEGQDTSADTALAIARNIHEVKKDYARVAAGIEAVLRPSAEIAGLPLSEVLSVVEKNTRRYLDVIDCRLSLTFERSSDFVTRQHYFIVSILNNLIINAIEACGERGRITVRQYVEEDNAVFVVEDNGCGIKPEDQQLIFQVGYSTKFSHVTGEMSTGLGLSHVKNLAEMLNGTVSVISQPEVFTRFTVILPLEEIKWTE